ncbi:MAG TPA: hypothetical protein VGM93_11905, partial [Acidimicrobiales bacterium]
MVALVAAMLATAASVPRAEALPITNPGTFVLNATGGNLTVGSLSFSLSPTGGKSAVIGGTASANGTITVPKVFSAGPPPQGISIPNQLFTYQGNDFTIKILPVGTGNFTGTLDPDTGAATFTAALRIKVEG